MRAPLALDARRVRLTTTLLLGTALVGRLLPRRPVRIRGSLTGLSAPFGRFRRLVRRWQPDERAQEALNSWTPNPQTSLAVELRAAFNDGLRFAASFVEERGDREVAVAIRRLADDGRIPR